MNSLKYLLLFVLFHFLNAAVIYERAVAKVDPKKKVPPPDPECAKKTGKLPKKCLDALNNQPPVTQSPPTVVILPNAPPSAPVHAAPPTAPTRAAPPSAPVHAAPPTAPTHVAPPTAPIHTASPPTSTTKGTGTGTGTTTGTGSGTPVTNSNCFCPCIIPAGFNYRSGVLVDDVTKCLVPVGQISCLPNPRC